MKRYTKAASCIGPVLQNSELNCNANGSVNEICIIKMTRWFNEVDEGQHSLIRCKAVMHSE